MNTWEGQRVASQISSKQNAFFSALSRKGIPYKKVRTYDAVLNAVAIEVNTQYVSEMKQMAGVESVVITTSYAEPEAIATTSNKNVVTNETSVYATGIYDSSQYTSSYGQGMVVAVLDTGLDYTHPAFQSFESENVNVSWTEDTVKSLLAERNLAAEMRSGTLEANDVYRNAKVPYAYDYADDDADVYPSYSNHGTHVAGIIGGYDTSGYTDKDGNPIAETFKGVVPDCQLAIFKVFTDDLDDPDLGGAVTEDIVAALNDCVLLGVDVINMSLGTSCGFTTTNDGDDEGEMLNEVYENIQKAGISLVCAASNDYSSGYGGVYGTNLASNPDSSTVGSPSTYAGALSVASINGQQASYFIANEGTAKESYVFFEESRDINSNPFDFVKQLTEKYGKTEFEYVVVPDIGQAADYSESIRNLFKDKSGNSLGRIALIKRGTTTFQEKVEIAMQMGAIGVIVFNNVSGTIRMNLGEIENPVPAVSIGMNAGAAMMSGAVSRIGVIKLGENQTAGPFMSEFSSWGPTHDLKLKPEITAHGGEITSTVPGGYGEQSGTSMASPNMAGVMAIMRSYVEKAEGITEAKEVNRRAMQLIMSTAVTAYDQDGLAYSPRKQGAGVANMDLAISSSAYLSTDAAENDYRPKLEVGDDPSKTGVYEMSFYVTNFGTETLRFTTDQLVMTETLASNGLTVNEQAYMFDDAKTVWKADGKEVTSVSVKAGEKVKLSVTVTLSAANKQYLDASFENGMYVEGFLKLVSDTQTQCDLNIPFLGFYGDWYSSPMLDYSSYEIAESEQDASVAEDEKLKASVYATQPFSSYYNEKYIIPMGGYVYLLADGDDPVYVDPDKAAVSRYNTYYGEGVAENYMSTTGIKAVYAGLLRNARAVKYRMYNVETGELILEDQCNRVGKAYAGGGSAIPANVELELSPEEQALVANGTYRLEFDFFTDGDGEYLDGVWVFPQDAVEENTYEFYFTVDYDAPIMQDARVRYYNYKENGVTKQRIYLDVDVFDNHYAQAIMLCYPQTDASGEVLLQLATEYPTPVRNANRNGTTTVSIEVTDIFEKYGSQLYIQIDDYALNSCLYKLNVNTANRAPITNVNSFDIVADKKLTVDENGRYTLTVDRYEAYAVSLNFEGNGDESNFIWNVDNPRIANVRNGEIVGLSPGTTVVSVSTGAGKPKQIEVTVTDKAYATLANIPSISFGVITAAGEALVTAVGNVKVNAGETFQIPVKTDPWYHPMTNLRLVWSSTDESVATVDENGNVSTLKKGTTVILAEMERWNAAKETWEKTLYSASVTLRVQNEFTVSNYILTDYNGLGYNEERDLDGDGSLEKVLVIPTDMNIWYIGEEAFGENDTITAIILPSSVIEIQARAFMNCKNLEAVYFVSEQHRVDENGEIIERNGEIIDWADLSMIYEDAFYGCTSLKTVDFSNTKTITVAHRAFMDCINLSEVIDMPSVGTMHHYAFANTALTSVDLTGLHMSGQYVFANCKGITEIKTGKFTAIGDYMFYGCTGLREAVTLSTPKIGNGAFYDCVNLTGVKFDGKGEKLAFNVGAYAFANCGSGTDEFTVDFNGEKIRSIGARAFYGSNVLHVEQWFNGLEVLGENVFANTTLSIITIGDGFDFETVRLQGIPFAGATLALEENTTKYTLENGILYNRGKTKIFYVNPQVKELVLDNTVTQIGDYAFAGSQVTGVTLHSGVTSIGVGAFQNSALERIDFNGAELREIPDYAFEGTKLPSIVLPNSVTTIGAYAFANSALSTLKADGVESLGDCAFAGCKALRGDRTETGKYVLTVKATTLGDRVFDGCDSLINVEFGSVKKMGRYTFNGAKSLWSASFGEETSSIGTYTFANTNVVNVSLGNTLKTIGEGVFYGCKSITEITIPDTVTKIGAQAFLGCVKLKSVNGIENVNVFGVQAFYESGLTSLNLAGAKEIGAYAFASTNKSMKYTQIYMPNVEIIGNFAFLNGGESEVTLPASLVSLGYGVFASSDNLTAIKADDSTQYFVENGVLYRVIEEGVYEALAYPAAAESVDALSIKEGVVRVEAYAFYGLNEGAVDKVILPYTLNTIGDSAFYASGIQEYTFESIQAPILETVYRDEIASAIEAVSNISYYKGYYYANFETNIYNYTSYGGEKSDLIMNYPANGKGYTNYLYSLYFGTKNATDILPEDDTRECIAMIESLPTASEIDAWLSWAKTAENKAIVQDMADKVKSARLYYNNTQTDASQSAFITEEMENKLFAVESSLRAVKKYFGVKITISSLRVAENSTHKSEYATGESFNMSGLVVEIVYDDYSTEIADKTAVALKTTEALTKYDRYVVVTYEGKQLRVAVTVSEEAQNVTDDEPEKESNLPLIIVLSIVGAAVLGGAGFAVFMVMKKRKTANSEAVDTTETEQKE